MYKSDWINDLERLNDSLSDAIATTQASTAGYSLSGDQCDSMWESHIITSSSDSATLIALLSADRLDVIRDLELRSALLAYANAHARTASRIERILGQLVNVVDNFADEFPRRLVDGPEQGSEVTCQFEKIRSNQSLQNRLLSNLSRRHAIVRLDRIDLKMLEELQAEISGYRPGP